MDFDNDFNNVDSRTGWTPHGDSISSPGDECTSELSYAVTVSSKSDQHLFSPYHINTLLSRQVMRIKKFIN